MRLAARLMTILALLAPVTAEARGALPAGFVYLREIDPSIVQDMRYATSDNFTGHPLPGYRAGECVLRRDVAQALRRVQADLAREHLSLKTYDCYRPLRAVRAMARWSQAPDTAPPTKRFFPALEKRTLFSGGYIAAQSAHSTGNAVDSAHPPARGARCALRPQRALRPLHRPRRAARARYRHRHGHRLRLLRRTQPHLKRRHPGRGKAPARPAGRGHAQARLP